MRHPNNKKGSRHRSDDHYAGSSEVPSHDAQSVGTPVEDEGSNTMIQSSTAFTNELEKGDVSEQQALDTRLLRTPTQASRDQTDASTTHTDISSWREEPRPGVAWLQGVTYTQFLARLQTVSGRDQILSLVQFGSLALHGSLQYGIAGGNCGQSLLKLSNMVANYRAQTRLWALLSVLSIPTLHEVFGGPEALLQHLLHSIRAIGSLVLLGPEWIVHWVLGRRPWGALSSMKNTDATAHSVVATTSRESAAIPLSELTARWVRIFQWFLELVFLRFENVGLLASVGVLQRPSPRAVQISLVAIAAWLVNLCVSLLVQFRDCVRPLTGKGEKKDRRRLQIHLLRTVCLWFVAQYALTPIRRGEVALHVFDEATLQVSDWKRCMNRSVQRGILTLLRMGWDVSSTCAGCMGTVATLCDFIAN